MYASMQHGVLGANLSPRQHHIEILIGTHLAKILEHII